jgi:glutathione S-transferase
VILWGRPTSVNVQKVLWALEEFGLPHEHRIVGGRHGGLDDPAFRALSPVAKVPVLDDAGQGVWESHAILRHLARREPAHPLAGTLGTADPWMEFGTSTLMPPFIGLFYQRVRLRPEERSAARAAALERDLTAVLTVMDEGLAATGWLSGAAFGLADIALGTPMYRLFDIAPGLLPGGARLHDWRARLARRPGWQRWIATDYSALRPG